MNTTVFLIASVMFAYGGNAQQSEESLYGQFAEPLECGESDSLDLDGEEICVVVEYTDCFAGPGLSSAIAEHIGENEFMCLTDCPPGEECKETVTNLTIGNVRAGGHLIVWMMNGDVRFMQRCCATVMGDVGVECTDCEPEEYETLDTE